MEMVDKFYEHEKYACIYYAYNTIHKYLVSFSYRFLDVGTHLIRHDLIYLGMKSVLLFFNA